MATPSSSTTTPSPSLSYIAPTSSSDQSLDDPVDREARQNAIQRFMARAELSKLTRALRARLSYASYKATHNVSHVPIRSLEVQLASKAVPTTATKRKAGGNNYYNNPATQGNSAMVSSAYDSGKKNAPHSSAAGAGASISNATQSLYNSILAPPPPKRARTIHNPDSAPLVPPTRVANTPKKSSSRSSAKHDKGKDRERGTVGARQRAGSQSSYGDGDNNDLDMKAAATLTELLLSRPLASTSPRSSFSTGSDTGSSRSYPLSLSQQFAQSSTRTSASVSSVANNGNTIGASAPPPPPSSAASVASTASEPRRSTTPTPLLGRPLTAAADSEAADLMLLLANSPSPARPTVVRDRDSAITRSVYAAGRVLFPSARDSGNGGSFSSLASVGGDEAGEPEKAGAGSRGSGEGSPDLTDGHSPPLSSSSAAGPVQASASHTAAPMVTPPTPPRGHPARPAFPFGHHDPTPAELLPPPPSPSTILSSSHATVASPRDTGAPSLQAAQAPPTPSAFDMNEYINVSPSPRARTGSALPPGTGLRVGGDGAIGRRLFETEGAGGGAGGAGGAARRMRFGEVEGGGLGTGIDLVKT